MQGTESTIDYLLYAIACLLQRSVVKYVTCVIRRNFGMLLAKNCLIYASITVTL